MRKLTKQEIAKLKKELKFKKRKTKTYNGDLDLYLEYGLGTRSKRDLYLNQYLKQGWDDTELKNFNNTLALFIYPRLQRYVELTKTKHFAYLEPLGLTKKQWNSILKKMLFTFKQYADYYAPDLHSDPRYRRRLKEGMQLFAKYFPYLEL